MIAGSINFTGAGDERDEVRNITRIRVTPSCGVTCLTSSYAAPVHHCAGAKRRRTMKHSKQIPTRLKIDVLIVVVGLGLIALGIVTTTARILGTSVQEYARLIPF